MKTMIRIEEASFVFLAYWLSIQWGFAWWLFIVLLFIPDISIAAYLFGSKTGAFIYNLFHHKAIAVLAGLAGYYSENKLLLLVALVLFGHSSLDRIFGFGLKLPDDFNNTHLGYTGKNNNQIESR